MPGMDGAPYHAVCGLVLDLLRRWVPACRTHSREEWDCGVPSKSSAPLVTGVGSEHQPRITSAVGRMNLPIILPDEGRVRVKRLLEKG
jgi:hypothetical protein